MSKEFFQQLYNRMHIVSKDWTFTLTETRTKLENAESLKGFVYQPITHLGTFISHGYIQGETRKDFQNFPAISSESEELIKNIMERFFEMERKDSIPDRNFLYSLVMDSANLYTLETGNDKILDQIFDVLITKSNEYGQGFRRMGYIGIRGRVWEKICRYISMKAQGRDTNENEPALDSLKDLLGYSIILLALTIE